MNNRKIKLNTEREENAEYMKLEDLLRILLSLWDDHNLRKQESKNNKISELIVWCWMLSVVIESRDHQAA